MSGRTKQRDPPWFCPGFLIAKRWYESGAYQRRLAATRIACDHQYRRPAQTLEESVGFRIASEEQPGIVRLKHLQATKGTVLAPIVMLNRGLCGRRQGTTRCRVVW